LSNRNSPDELSAKSTVGFTAVSHVRRTFSRRFSSVSDMYSVARGSLYCALPTMARTAAASSFDTIRAAQNASSGRMFSNAVFGYSGFHFSGSNASPSKRPTDAGTWG
jgi:hypothetical protein